MIFIQLKKLITLQPREIKIQLLIEYIYIYIFVRMYLLKIKKLCTPGLKTFFSSMSSLSSFFYIKFFFLS